MAIRQITGTEDVPQLKNQIDDDNGSWWGGVRLAGATTIALAAGLAITALSSQVAQNVANSHQDDPAGSLVNLKVEEDYWQSNVRPVVMAFAQYQMWDDASFAQAPAAGAAALGRPVRLGMAFPAFR